MKILNRIMTNICSDYLVETKNFYTKLFDYESDWFIHLISKENKLELGIIQKSNDLVPVEFQNKPQGFYISFVVENADEIFKIAEKENYEIVSIPEDTFYGQRRLLLKDPSGSLVDISSPIKGFEF